MAKRSFQRPQRHDHGTVSTCGRFKTESFPDRLDALVRLDIKATTYSRVFLRVPNSASPDQLGPSGCPQEGLKRIAMRDGKGQGIGALPDRAVSIVGTTRPPPNPSHSFEDAARSRHGVDGLGPLNGTY